MPISSTQVSNIIGGQMGMFSASAQYSQAISAQYGFQPSGAPFGADPFQQQQMQQQLGAGGRIANTGIGAGHAAMGIASGAAMFGMAPRMLDPFTMGMHAFSGGRAAGGMMGGLASGAMAFGGVSAAIGAAGWGLNQMQPGAQNRQMLTQQAGAIMPGMGVGGLNAVAGQIESMNRQGMGSLQELTGLMKQGANSGALSTSSLSDFTMSFQKLVSNVRQVATALNSSMSQAQQAMQQVKAIGISSDSAAGFLGTSRAFGSQVGMGPQQMMQMATVGSSFAANSGISRELGATGAITQAGVYGLANRQGIAGVLPDSYQRYMGGASRFLGSRQGRSVLGAMLDTNTGGLNMQVARQISAGGMTRGQINDLSRSNIASFGRDEFESSRGELGASFISNFGPQGLGRAIGDMTANSANPQQLRRMLTGLSRADMVGMQNLQAQTGRLTNELVNSARAGFREGQQQQTFSGALKQSWEHLVKPVKDQFKSLGASMTKSMQEAVGQFTGEFARTNHTASAGAQHAAYNRHFRAATMGGDAGFLSAIDRGAGNQEMAFDLAPGGPGDQQGFLAQMGRRLPSGMRIGAYSQGTTFSELPMGGFGTEEYSGYQTAAAFGMRPAGHALGFAGRHAFRGFGSAASWVGSRFPSTGFMGMGGRGLAGGTLMAGARGGQGLSLLARGAGGLARGLGPAAMAYDVVTNMVPEARRRQGFDPIVAGAITGAGARQTNFLMDSNVLNEEDGDYREMDVSAYHGMSSSEREGLTPVGGLSRGTDGGRRSGRQRFLTEAGRNRIMQLRDRTTTDAADRRFTLTGNATSSGAILSAVSALGDSLSGKTDMERVNDITEKLREQGHRSVRPRDVVIAGRGLTNPETGRAIFDSEEMVRRRVTDPNALRRTLSAQLEREMSVQMLQAQAGGALNLNNLSPADRAQMKRELEESFGNDSVSGGQVSHTLLNSTSSLDPNASGFTDQFQSGTALQSRITANMARGTASNTGMGSPFSFGAQQRIAATAGQNNGQDANAAAWRTGTAAAIIGDDSMRNQVTGLATQYRQAGDDRRRRNTVISDLRATLNQNGDFREIMGGTIGGQSMLTNGASDADLRALLTSGEEGFADQISAISELEDSRAYGDARRSRRRLHSEQNHYLNRGSREVAEMSGGNSNSVGVVRSAASRWYGVEGMSTERRAGRGEYSRSIDVAARQELMDSLQLRLRPNDYNGAADNDEISAAIGAGGMMSMADLDRMGAEFLEENDPAMRDLGQTVTNMARFRRLARTNDGMGRGRDQVDVAKRLGIRVSGDSMSEDKAFLRGEENSVMSLNLERQLRTMARSALEAASPGAEITNDQLEQRMGQMTSALRTGRSDGYEALNRVMNTQMAPTSPNTAAPAGQDGSSTSATMSALDTNVQQFNRLVSSMNSAMSGGATDNQSIP